MAKVYVSSTFVDLQEHREKIKLVLRRMGHEDVAMEYYVAENQRPVDRCLSDVAQCDLYVGIFAWRYGWIPEEGNPERLSITEMEFRQAEKHGKPCLIFLLSDEAPWPPKFIDSDRTRIEKLRNELSAKYATGTPFKTADDLGRLAAESIHHWEKEHGQASSRALIRELDLSVYFAALTKRYQRLDLDALTPPQKEEYLQLQLRSIFVEQNVRENPPPVELPKEIWEKLQRDKEIHPEDFPAGIAPDDVLRAREAYYEKPSRPVLDAFTDSRHQHSIVLGDPGSGKSTLARYVLLSLINDAGDEKLRGAFEGHLSLLIELRSYAGLYAENKCDTFLEFVEYLSKTEGWQLDKTLLDHYLKTDGRAVVIFDGLDEIFDPEDREQIARRIVGFSSDYPKARIIVTSRIIGYRRKILTDAGFVHFTLQDLDEQQIAMFVDRWYALALSDRPEEATARRERILRSFSESTSIRQLAGNPMLLTIMAIIGKNQELPRERWKLYDHAASVLIQHWDVSKHLKDSSIDAPFIGEEDKKELLRRLAFKMQGGVGGLAGNYIHHEQLQTEFEAYLKERYGQPPDRATTIARAMIEQFRERNFILSLYGANLYGFVHRAFLEYFCATAFTHKFEKTQEMTLDELKRNVYGMHWEDRSWHEVLRLICGMIDEKFAGEIIDFLTNEIGPQQSESDDVKPAWNLTLATQCLGELRNIGTVAEPARNLLKAICTYFEDVMTGSFSRGFFRGDLFTFLEESLAPSVEVIGSNWPHRDELAGRLRRLEVSGFPSNYAESFGTFVGSVGQGLDEVYQVILNFAVHEDAAYRILAPMSLAKGWHDDARTLSSLQDMALKDESYEVRRTAIWVLGEYFHHDAGLFPMLRDFVLNDASRYVRYLAVTILSKHFRDDPRTLPLIRDHAINDKESFVQQAAIRALTERFRDDERTFSLLRAYAIKHQPAGFYSEIEFVYMIAIEGIAKYWPSHPDTLPLLRQLAQPNSSSLPASRIKELADKLEGLRPA
jgi:hypothetical protein